MNIFLGMTDTGTIIASAEAPETSTAVATASAASAGSDNHFEFFSFDVTTIVGTLLNTLILFLVLKHFLFDKVNKVLNDRNSEVAKTFEDAEKAKTDAEALKTEYSEKLACAKEESAEIVRNATKKAEQRSEEIIGSAKAEAESVMDKASADIEREKKRAVNQIKDEISDIAISVAEKVIGKEISADTHEKLISDFIDGIGSGDAE